MANASGLISPSVPRIRQRNLPSFRYSRSGPFPLNRNTKRFLQCSAVEGAGQHASRVSPSESRVPRFVIQGCKLVGCGSAVPNRIISNDDIAKIVETSAKWISERTGICNRRVLSGEETLTGLSVEAAKKALQMAQVDPNDLDLILLCTSTPDDRFGSAPQIQKALCPKRFIPAYDIKAACSGFVVGLDSAACYIRAGERKNVLVVGADALSRCVDWTDRATCILFGDGAGAVLVQACDVEEKGLFGFDLHTDGNGGRHLNARVKDDETEHASGSIASVLGFPPRRAFYSYIQMNGSEVFRFAVERVPPSIESALQNSGLTVSDIDFLLLHQANQRIIDAVAMRLGVPPERVISNLHDYGNTGAASISLALDEAVRSGKVQPGHLIAASGFGAGLTWGSAIFRWG